MSRRLLHVALTTLLCAGRYAAGAPETASPHFERIGAESGPLSGVATAIYQDKGGFLWIGSRDGLTLYDGHSFTVFEHDPSDAGSISDNVIRTLFEDSKGSLWVGTNTGGLNRLDRSTRRFERFRHDSADPGSLSHDSVYAVAEDGAGRIWVATQRGLNRLEPGARKFRRFMADPETAGGLSHNYVSSLMVDRQGRLWAGTVGGGLARFDDARESFHVWRPDPRRSETLRDASVFALLEDATGAIWAGTNTGLDRMDPRSGDFEHVALGPGDREPRHSIINALAVSPGKLWIGSFGGGLYELDTASRAVRVMRHDASDAGSLPADRVLSLLADRAGDLWVGTWGGGLSRLSGAALLLAAAGGELTAPTGVPERDVTALARDAGGALWIGLRSGGLLRKEAGGSYRNFLPEGTSSILRIQPARDGAVWAATTGGLVRLTPQDGSAITFRHDERDPASLGAGYVTALLEDRQGRLWAGTGEGGLQEIAGDGRVLHRFQHDPANASSLSDDYVTAIHLDRGGTMWVGTRSGGVNAVDPATGRATRYLADPADPHAISHHNVTAIFEDSAGRLWIATAGGGLNRVEADPAGGRARFRRFTTSDGLVNNNVMAILEDDDGSLWLSTKRGVSRFAPGRDAFANYSVSDGLPSGEFEFGAAIRALHLLCFGSVKWIVPIPAGTPFPRPVPSPTVISSLRTQGRQGSPGRPAWALERLEIPYGTWFSIELAVLDYDTAHNHAHAYRLGRGESGWIDMGPRREITFTDLRPGSYEFVARGRNCQGVWTETSPPLQIQIVPPFWMTLWFRLLCAGGLLAAALLSHRARISSLQRRHQELVRLHDQRERAVRELEQAHERLQILARRLEAAKEEERRSIARELHDELGPTLTAVVINLQLLGKGALDAQQDRRIRDSVDLIDRMVQRIRDLSLDLRPPLLDEMGLVAALEGYLETQAERTGIKIAVHGSGVAGALPAEAEITAFRVTQEAVTNAIRHAAARCIDVTLTRGSEGIEISVEDDGLGFDTRAALEGPATGKHLGLLGMQERARMLGGEVEIQSTPGRGTRVRIRIPLPVAV